MPSVIHFKRAKHKGSFEKTQHILLPVSMTTDRQTGHKLEVLLDYLGKSERITTVSILLSGYLHRYHRCVEFLSDTKEENNEACPIKADDEKCLAAGQSLNDQWKSKNKSIIEDFKEKYKKPVHIYHWEDVIEGNREHFDRIYATLSEHRKQNNSEFKQQAYTVARSKINEKHTEIFGTSSEARQQYIQDLMELYLLEETAVFVLVSMENVLISGEQHTFDGQMYPGNLNAAVSVGCYKIFDDRPILPFISYFVHDTELWLYKSKPHEQVLKDNTNRIYVWQPNFREAEYHYIYMNEAGIKFEGVLPIECCDDSLKCINDKGRRVKDESLQRLQPIIDYITGKHSELDADCVPEKLYRSPETETDDSSESDIEHQHSRTEKKAVLANVITNMFDIVRYKHGSVTDNPTGERVLQITSRVLDRKPRERREHSRTISAPGSPNMQFQRHQPNSQPVHPRSLTPPPPPPPELSIASENDAKKTSTQEADESQNQNINQGGGRQPPLESLALPMQFYKAKGNGKKASKQEADEGPIQGVNQVSLR